ncbi:hypothetical protein MMC10_010686 [Thelotrema lepadinum]|nr:hypothetical protein [Thelotrema lepadinum]
MASDPEPIVKHIYIADPSAHSFNDRIYIYPSHDRETPIPDDDHGSQYDMVDYHVVSLSEPGSSDVTDHGVALSLESIPWAGKQVWAPDAAFANGKYYFYFPARNHKGQFQIGVAEGTKPEGPFTPDPEPIPGSFSIDPASFVDTDGSAYLYFGGIWGGQLQCYQEGDQRTYNASAYEPQEPSGTGPALLPRVAKLVPDMHKFDPNGVQQLEILAPETGKLIEANDHARRFFEASWVHKKGDTYYFSYSTGDTHYIAYATGKSPMGPFTYAGRLLEPVVGWTTHHSIVEHKGKWWLFYHDSSLSGGKNHLRSAKCREIIYDGEGLMHLKDPQK